MAAINRSLINSHVPGDMFPHAQLASLPLSHDATESVARCLLLAPLASHRSAGARVCNNPSIGDGARPMPMQRTRFIVQGLRVAARSPCCVPSSSRATGCTNACTTLWNRSKTTFVCTSAESKWPMIRSPLALNLLALQGAGRLQGPLTMDLQTTICVVPHMTPTVVACALQHNTASATVTKSTGMVYFKVILGHTNMT